MYESKINTNTLEIQITNFWNSINTLEIYNTNLKLIAFDFDLEFNTTPSIRNQKTTLLRIKDKFPNIEYIYIYIYIYILDI